MIMANYFPADLAIMPSLRTSRRKPIVFVVNVIHRNLTLVNLFLTCEQPIQISHKKIYGIKTEGSRYAVDFYDDNVLTE